MSLSARIRSAMLQDDVPIYEADLSSEGSREAGTGVPELGEAWAPIGSPKQRPKSSMVARRSLYPRAPAGPS